MNGQWNWLIGRKLSLGEVVDVFGESATVRHGDDETRVLLCELLEEDYKTHDRYLDPPDEESDDTTDDEMDLADIKRQRKIDHEDWQAERLRQRQEDTE